MNFNQSEEAGVEDSFGDSLAPFYNEINLSVLTQGTFPSWNPLNVEHREQNWPDTDLHYQNYWQDTSNTFRLDDLIENELQYDYYQNHNDITWNSSEPDQLLESLVKISEPSSSKEDRTHLNVEPIHFHQKPHHFNEHPHCLDKEHSHLNEERCYRSEEKHNRGQNQHLEANQNINLNNKKNERLKRPREALDASRQRIRERRKEVVEARLRTKCEEGEKQCVNHRAESGLVWIIRIVQGI